MDSSANAVNNLQTTAVTRADLQIAVEADGKNKERGQWTNQMEFLLSCIGYAVGLGNVWRFPYLCFKNGGGAFLIPYTLMLALCGLPMFFLELALGQYHGQGPNITFYHLAPAFQGLGYAMLMVAFLITLYYNVIMAWSIFYLFASFTSELPWTNCGNQWNEKECFVKGQSDGCQEQNLTFWNNTCTSMEAFCHYKEATLINASYCQDSKGHSISWPKRVSPSEDYFSHYVLDISKTMDDFGSIRWQLALCLLLAWIMVLLCLIKGVRSSGKVVYFTALFPYVVLVILFIRGVTLDGAGDGIYFYMVPEWGKLADIQVWNDAAVQIFFSLGPSLGGVLTLASYNKFTNNCHRDAILVALINCGTSVFAGFAIFSVLGFMAHTANVPVKDVVDKGPGLAFVVYPEAMTKMPLSPLWAFLFFFMLILLGLDSQFATVETLITAVHDQWPKLRNYKAMQVICTCGICYLLALPMCAQGGMYLFTLLNDNSAGWSLLAIGLCEVILISWLYGSKNFEKNICQMIGHAPNWYWVYCWKYFTPVTMAAILVFSFINYEPASYKDQLLPPWANVLGWLMATVSVILIPIFGIYQLYKFHKAGKTLLSAFKPSEKWGPSPSENNGNDTNYGNPNGISNPAFSEEYRF